MEHLENICSHASFSLLVQKAISHTIKEWPLAQMKHLVQKGCLCLALSSTY